jgi:hypothetical protein
MIETTCPGCGEVDSFPDRTAGDQTRCRTCDTLFTIRKPARKPAGRKEEGEARRRRAQRDRDDESETPRAADQPRSRVPLFVVGGAALFSLLVGLGIVFVVWAGRARPADNSDATAQAPENGPAPAPAAPSKGDDAVEPVAWQYRPDPGPRPRAGLGARPISLTVVNGVDREVHDVRFSSPDVGQAVVLYSMLVEPETHTRLVRAARFDLVTGKMLDHFDLFRAENARIKEGSYTKAHLVKGSGIVLVRGALSPDGSRLLVQRLLRQSHQLEIWDLNTRKQVGAWAPEGTDNVGWFDFIDNGRVLTSTTRSLTLWRLPECKVVYRKEGVYGIPAISPGRKYLACRVGKSVGLLDSATGEPRGILGAGSTPFALYVTPGFSPDGKELVAGLLNRSARGPARPLLPGSKSAEAAFQELAPAWVMRLGRWNLETGRHLVSLTARVERPPLILAKPFVLYGQSIYHWDVERRPICEYHLTADLRVGSTPDQRLWVVRKAGPERPLHNVLVACEPFPAKARELGEDAERRRIKPVLEQGMAVEVLATSNKGPKSANYLRQMTEKALRKQGLTIGPGGMTLEISCRYYTNRGSPGASCKAVLTDAFGKVVYKDVSELNLSSGRVYSMEGGTRTYRGFRFGDDPATHFQTLRIPWNKVRVGGILTTLPVVVRLPRSVEGASELPAESPSEPSEKPKPPKRKPVRGTGLVAHWTFDDVKPEGKVEDSSGRGNHGTNRGALRVRGVKGFALGFDGGRARRYVEYGPAADFDFGAGDNFTYAGWCFVQYHAGTILSQNNEGPRAPWGLIQIRVLGGKLEAVVHDDRNRAATLKAGKVDDKRWHHFALVRDGRRLLLYLDGRLAQSVSDRTPSGSITTRHRSIGADSVATKMGWNALSVFHGGIDEVRICRSALSAAEIEKLARKP